MQPLIIYYSLDGNTRLIAREIAAETGGELLELSPLKGYGKGFSRYLGNAGSFLPPPASSSLYVQPRGVPAFGNWHSRVGRTDGCPYADLFNSPGPSERDIALFCTHRGDPGRTLAGMAKMLRGNRITGQLSLLMRNNNRESGKMARSWARDLYA